MKITMEKLFILFRHYVSLYIVFVVSPMLTILIMWTLNSLNLFVVAD